MKDTLYIVMPAYNEEANIEDVINQWHPVCERINAEGNEAKLVIANDGSKDNTFAIMQQLSAKYPFLMPIDKPNSGHGATVLFLYRKAIADGANFVFQTDSDGQTLPEEFWQMWKNRHEHEFQIGTRGGREDGASRVFVTKTLSKRCKYTIPLDECYNVAIYHVLHTRRFLLVQCGNCCYSS